MPNNPLSSPTLRRQAEQLLSEGQTGSALELFFPFASPEVALLKKRFDAAHEHFLAGRMTFEIWLQELSRINYAILDLWQEGNLPAPAPLVKSRVEALLQQDKIGEALDLMVAEDYRDAILSSARYQVAKAHFADRPGHEDWIAIRAQIKFALEHFLEAPRVAKREAERPANETPPGGIWGRIRGWFG